MEQVAYVFHVNSLNAPSPTILVFERIILCFMKTENETCKKVVWLDLAHSSFAFYLIEELTPVLVISDGGFP